MLQRAAILTLLVILGCLGSASAQIGIVSLEAHNFGSRERNVPVTFGTLFARGDVPKESRLEIVGSGEKPIPFQLDAKARHPDGSLRHAVVTLMIPELPTGATMPVIFRRAGATSLRPPDRDITISDLPKDFDATVSLIEGSHRLVASATQLLRSGRTETWLRGPYVSEWWAAGSFRDQDGKSDPHLRAQFGIRCYGTGRPLRIEVIVENDWTFVPHPQTEVYDAEIRVGGKPVFQQSGIVQPSQTRWRRGFWWQDPISVYVKQNLRYLEKARAVPNYDPALEIPGLSLKQMYSQFQASDRRPMAPGIITAYMPTTGSRADIAPLPQWQAVYLLSMRPEAYEVMLQTADLGAGFPAHYRNEKSGRPTTPEDYPVMSTVTDIFGEAGQPERRNDMGHKETLVPDPAHEPALDFLPYLVTGDRFYLEELQFWAMWNALNSGPQYRGYGAGLLHSAQIRAQAWSLRTLAQTEYITPDSDALKPLLRRELKANIDWFDNTYGKNHSANRLGIIERADDYDGGRSMAPWQDDYFTWSIGYVQGLGDVDAQPLLRWKAKFPVGRMIAPGFCWQLATAYTLRVRDRAEGPIFANFASVDRASLEEKTKRPDAASLACGSAELSTALGITGAGGMLQGNYAPYMRAALAAGVDAGADGADAAWRAFQLHAPAPDTGEPEWDIVPAAQVQRVTSESK